MPITEPATTPKPRWHPCDDCIDAIKRALDELAEVAVPGPDVFGYTSTCYSNRLGNAYQSADRELGRLWLASFLSPYIAGEFSERLQSVYDDLRNWEERAQHLADPRDWPNPDEPDDVNDQTGLSRRLWDAFIEIQDQAAFTAQYLGKLSAIIRAKMKEPKPVENTDSWQPPEGYMKATAVVAPDGDAVSRQTVSSWAERHPPGDKAKDPRSGAVYYPQAWIDERLRGYKRLQ